MNVTVRQHTRRKPQKPAVYRDLHDELRLTVELARDLDERLSEEFSPEEIERLEQTW